MIIYNILQYDRFMAFLRKIEMFGTWIIIYAMVMVLLNLPISGIVLALGLSAMVIVSFFSGFRKLKVANKFFSSFFFFLNGWGLVFSYIICFLIWKHWLTSVAWLLLGIIIIICSLILGLLYHNDENSHLIDKFYFMRLLNALTLMSYLFFKDYQF